MSSMLDIYRELVEKHWGLPVKGKATPYTSLNGNMFSFLSKEGQICLRLSHEDQQAFWDAYGGEPVMQYGSVMRGYVALPSGLLGKDSDLEPWFIRCLENAESLPVKATRKNQRL